MNGLDFLTVYKLQSQNEIVAFAFSERQLKNDIVRLNLSGEIIPSRMRLFLVEIMAKSIAKSIAKNRI